MTLLFFLLSFAQKWNERNKKKTKNLLFQQWMNEWMEDWRVQADWFHVVSFSVYDLEKGMRNCIISGHGHIGVEMGIGNYLLGELKRSHTNRMHHTFYMVLFELYNLYIIYIRKCYVCITIIWYLTVYLRLGHFYTFHYVLRQQTIWECFYGYIILFGLTLCSCSLLSSDTQRISIKMTSYYSLLVFLYCRTLHSSGMGHWGIGVWAMDIRQHHGGCLFMNVYREWTDKQLMSFEIETNELSVYNRQFLKNIHMTMVSGVLAYARNELTNTIISINCLFSNNIGTVCHSIPI